MCRTEKNGVPNPAFRFHSTDHFRLCQQQLFAYCNPFVTPPAIFSPTTSSTFFSLIFASFFVFTTIATHPIVFRQPFLSIYLTVVFNQPSFNPILLPCLLCFFLNHSPACLQPTYVLTSNQFRQPFRVFLRPSASTVW